MLIDVKKCPEQCETTESLELWKILKENNGKVGNIRNEVSVATYLLEFSAQNSNIVHVLPAKTGQHVLEIGSSYGNRTKILADEGVIVDCIEPDVYKGQVASILNKEKNNVNIYAGYTWIEKQFELNDAYDIIYIWDIGALGVKINSCVLMELMKKTNDQGKILMGVDNKYGIKYWNGYRISQNESFFSTLLGERENALPYNYITEMLADIDAKVEWYYPFPDMFYTEMVYSDKRMPQCGDIEKMEIPSKVSVWHNFDENRVMREVVGDDLYRQFANSYLIEIGGDTDG